ncbi:hypothetical protein [Flavobacterium sp.]|uniref:hypothetical protein n=1 Tax=Flavobacterium sp. TaxID=239 RepID=UPI00333E3760
MKYKSVKEILEILLVKKNNFIIEKEEQELLIELQILLALANSSNSIEVNLECNCELDCETIEEEVEINQCLDCGLPLSIL